VVFAKNHRFSEEKRLPNLNLFMLVSALMGRERMQAAYAHAIAAGYRFYSYGDASLLLPVRA
jgi:S-adenosylmethionine:tRNA ribosyltransferase-isomerase